MQNLTAVQWSLSFMLLFNLVIKNTRKSRKPSHGVKCLTHTHTHTKTHIQDDYVCSPCNDIRGEAHHKCADECTDLLGGPQPPPLLLIQAFLAHAAKAHRYHYLPRRRDQRHADLMKQSTEKTYEMDVKKAANCASLSLRITIGKFHTSQISIM